MQTIIVDVDSNKQNQTISDYSLFGWKLVGVTGNNSVKLVDKIYNYELQQEKAVKLTFQRDESILKEYPELKKLEAKYHSIVPPTGRIILTKEPNDYDRFTSDVAKKKRIWTIIILLFLIPISLFVFSAIPGWFEVGLFMNLVWVIALFITILTDPYKRGEYLKHVASIERYNKKVPQLQKEEDDHFKIIFKKYLDEQSVIRKKVESIMKAAKSKSNSKINDTKK